MNQKYLAIAAIIFIAWYAWFFRYDLDNDRAVLDRWTGNVIFDGHDKDDLSRVFSFMGCVAASPLPSLGVTIWNG